jgi:hypothetical protein
LYFARNGNLGTFSLFISFVNDEKFLCGSFLYSFLDDSFYNVFRVCTRDWDSSASFKFPSEDYLPYNSPAGIEFAVEAIGSQWTNIVKAI